MQLKLYGETSKTVGTLVSEPLNSIKWKDARSRFDALYWSELSVVENWKVERGMMRVRECLLEYDKDPRREMMLHRREEPRTFSLMSYGIPLREELARA